MLTPGFKDMLNGMGRRISDLRRQQGLTQEQLAEKSGLDRVSVGYIEQGRRSPKLSTLYTLAKALDCGIGDFFA
ncbi:helix-turn-helix transcriptional regulator [Bifidobacterium sp. ESL0728]|uniref:helix-turn-helix transcriptional regulator n=1 Tax=Bifidobacterium sp. ESL0728 TaxID=2983220 RepID=UPI0023F70D1D|nr:helix-turn-helix transcriptional regulator [Bifidobacterium sp. ESL0728]WEV58961.1 helix-turn-helix transcriptional regulator [Bifidobacterium sp. ESL0728]